MVVFSPNPVIFVVLTLLFSSHFQVENVQLNGKLMKKIANFSADPCEDFYQYACGNFLKVFPNPFSKNTWGLKRAAQLQINSKLIQLLSENKWDDSRAVNMARRYYRECLQDTWHDETHLLQIIKMFKHWPLYGYNKDWDYQVNFATLWSFEDFMEKAFKYHTFPFFQISVKKFVPAQIVLRKPEFKASQYIHFKEAVTESLRRLENAHRKAENDKVYKKIKNIINFLTEIGQKLRKTLKNGFRDTSLEYLTIIYISMLHKTFGKIILSYRSVDVKELSEDIEKIVKDMWRLEQELAKLATFGASVVKDFKNLNVASNINWPCDMQRLLTRLFKGTLRDHLIVIYDRQEYFSELRNVLQKYSKRTVASYIVWRVIYSLSTKMGKTPYRTIEPGQIAWKKNEETNKLGQCLYEVAERFKFVVMRLYAKHYLSNTSRLNVHNIFHQVKLVSIARKFKFFDKASWRKSKRKLYRLKASIFYPDFILDNKQLDDYYKLYRGNYLNMNIQHSLMLTHLQREKLHNKYDRKHWDLQPLVANADYHLGLNRIHIAAGEAAIFHYAVPWEINFGHIGFLVGHELAHAILLAGWSTNEKGKFDYWLSENALHNFQHIYSCYIEKYSEMKMFGRKINGKISIEETMADGAGLFLAYKGLEKLWGTGLKYKTEANLNLTKAQTFFLSYAQSGCKVYYEETSSNKFQSTHPFNNIRIKGTLQNSLEFAKAFNCKPGSTYNPRKKCLLY